MRWLEYVGEVVGIRPERIVIGSGEKYQQIFHLKKKKLVDRRHWIGNEVETSEALGIARICTNKGRLSFESAMLL